MQKTKLTTPRAMFIWPFLNKPHQGKFDDVPTYKCTVKFDRSNAKHQAFFEKLKEMHAEVVAEAQEAFDALKPAAKKKLGGLTINDFYEDELDEETGDETGFWAMKFKRKAEGVKKDGSPWTAKIALFNRFGKPFDKSTLIRTGSEGQLQLFVDSYFVPATGACGLRFKINGALINSVIEGDSAEAMGFDIDEYEETEEDDAEGFDTDTDGSDEDSDF